MKNKIYKILATGFALTLIVASPGTCITSHAQGFNIDAPTYVDDSPAQDSAPSNYSSPDSGASSNESSEPAAPAPEYSAPSDSGSHDDGGSSENSSYEDNSSSYDSGSSSSAPAPTTPNKAASTGAGNKSNDVTVNVTGGQKFRIVTASDHTTYQVYHCGISRASFKVTDADGNAVAFSEVTLQKGDDNLWYMNISFAKGVDTKDFTVTVTKGDATYLSSNLGVSGIKVNGVLALSTVPATDAK